MSRATSFPFPLTILRYDEVSQPPLKLTRSRASDRAVILHLQARVLCVIVEAKLPPGRSKAVNPPSSEDAHLCR